MTTDEARARAAAHSRRAIARRFHTVGALDDAIRLYTEALAAWPDDSDSLHWLGVARHESGDSGAALPLIRKALAIAPENGRAWSNLGAVLHALGQYEDAIEAFRAARARHGPAAEAESGLAAALLVLDRPREARTHAERALAHDPRHVGALVNCGNALHAQGERAAAIGRYREALAIAPRSREALVNLAMALWQAGDEQEALRRFRDCCEHGFASADVHTRIGQLLVALQRHGEARAAFEEALSLDPGHYQAHVALGDLAASESRMEDAADHYRNAYAARPNDGLRIRMALRLPAVYQSMEALVAARTRLEEDIAALARAPLAIGDPVTEVGVTNFRAAYQGYDDRPLQTALADLYLSACPSLRYVAPHCRAPAPVGPERRIRLGFVSTRFGENAVAWYLRGILAGLPRDRFAVALVSCGGDRDRVWPPLLGDEDEVVAAPADLAGARQVIADRRFDILVYPEIGMEPLTYFLAFARLAPVQCVTWGHPVTTGIPTVDYFLSADAAEPPGAEAHYSETLVRLAGLTTHYRRPEPPAPLRPRAHFGLADGRPLYLFPHALFKLHPDTDAAFAEILARDGRGEIVLFGEPTAHAVAILRARFARSLGTDAERIRFLPRVSFPDFLNIMALADVVLDSFPFAGGNTTFQALGLDTPVVSMPGRFLAGRTAAMLYGRIGLTELLAADAADYADIAVKLANEPAYRAAVRRHIRAAHGSVFEDPVCVKAWAAFLAQAAENIGGP